MSDGLIEWKYDQPEFRIAYWFDGPGGGGEARDSGVEA